MKRGGASRRVRVVTGLAALALGACTGGVAASHPSSEQPSEPPRPAAEDVCPRFSAGERVGQVTAPDLAELSGIAASRVDLGILWTHEDSGNPADLVAIRPDGKVVRTFRLAGVTARDWEDIAVGPGPSADPPATYVYLGDIGDNLADQPTFHAVRVREPVVDAAAADAKRTELEGAVSLTGRYPDGPHDAEALLSDPRTGDLIVVTKSDKGRSGVYLWAAPQSEKTATTLAAVGTVDVNALDGAIDRRITAGDISPDGSMILLRTYTNAWLWRRGADDTVAEALARPPCAVPLELEKQGEAIGWDATGAAYYSTTEGARPPIMRYTRE